MASCSDGVFGCDLGLMGAITSDIFCFGSISSEVGSVYSGLLKGSDLCMSSVEIVSVTKARPFYGFPISYLYLFLKVKG